MYNHLTKIEWDDQINQFLSILKSYENDDDYFIKYEGYKFEKVDLAAQRIYVRRNWNGDYYSECYEFSYPKPSPYSFLSEQTDSRIRQLKEPLVVFKIQKHKKLFGQRAIRKNKIKNLL